MSQSHTLQVRWRLGRWLELQSDFSVFIDRVNHTEILYNLCSAGIGGSVFSMLTQFQSNRPQHVMVDCCPSKRVNVVSAEPQGSVLGPLLFLLYTSVHFSIIENKFIGR